MSGSGPSTSSQLVQYKTVCRLCLSKCDSFTRFLPDPQIKHEIQEAISSLKLVECTALSQLVCGPCFDKITQFNQFQRQVRSNQKMLQILLEDGGIIIDQLQEIKEEPLEESIAERVFAREEQNIFVSPITLIPTTVKKEVVVNTKPSPKQMDSLNISDDADYLEDKPEPFDCDSDADPEWKMDDGGQISDDSDTDHDDEKPSISSVKVKRSASVKVESPDGEDSTVKVEEIDNISTETVPKSSPLKTPSGKPAAKPFRESKDGKLVYCPECNKSFTDKFVLQRHGDLLHPQYDWHMRSLMWRCRFCSSEFKTTRMKKAHELLCRKADNLTPVLQEELRRKSLPYTKTGKPKAPAMLINQKDSSVFCPICLMKFKSKWNAQKHGQALHDEYDWFFRPPKLSRNCKYCGKTFCKAAMREDHEMKCGGEQTPYECAHCDFKSFYRGSLRDHMAKHRVYPDDSVNTHHEYLNRPGIFPCEICGEISRNKKSYYNHKGYHKKQNKRLATLQEASGDDPEAGKKLERLMNRIGTKKTHVEEYYPFRCDRCINSMFRTEEGLQAHLEWHNPDQKRAEALPFACNLCEQRFGMEKILTRHLANHEKGKLDCCQTCGRTLKKDQMVKHQMIHDGEKKFMCEVCGKKFLYKHAVTDHMKIHSIGPDELECEKCGLKTNRRQIMSLHSKRCKYKYKGAPPMYRCSYCGQEFDKISARSRHVRNEHVGFRCVRCSVQFTCYTHLKHHRMSTEHKQMKLVKKGLMSMEEFKRDRGELAFEITTEASDQPVQVRIVSG